MPSQYTLIILSLRAQNFQISVGFTDSKQSGTILRNARILYPHLLRA